MRPKQGATPIILRMQAQTATRFENVLAHVTFTEAGGRGSQPSVWSPYFGYLLMGPDQPDRVWDPGRLINHPRNGRAPAGVPPTHRSLLALGSGGRWGSVDWPPYDPYEETPKASRRSLETALEEEAVAARRAAEEEARAARWEERQKRQREDRAGERFTSACKRARQLPLSARRRSAYFAPPRDLGRCLAPGFHPGPSGSLRRGPRAGPSSLV